MWTNPKEIAGNGIDDDKTGISMIFMAGVYRWKNRKRYKDTLRSNTGVRPPEGEGNLLETDACKK